MQYIYNGDYSKLIEESGAFIDSDGTQYPGSYPKSTIPGMVPVVYVDHPSDADFHIYGFKVEEVGGKPTQVWITKAKTDAERRGSIAQQIVNIENAIPERRKREALLTQAGKDWILAKDNEIAALRATM